MTSERAYTISRKNYDLFCSRLTSSSPSKLGCSKIILEPEIGHRHRITFKTEDGVTGLEAHFDRGIYTVNVHGPNSSRILDFLYQNKLFS